MSEWYGIGCEHKDEDTKPICKDYLEDDCYNYVASLYSDEDILESLHKGIVESIYSAYVKGYKGKRL
jgi:hypothetical protein